MVTGQVQQSHLRKKWCPRVGVIRVDSLSQLTAIHLDQQKSLLRIREIIIHWDFKPSYCEELMLLTLTLFLSISARMLEKLLPDVSTFYFQTL